MTDIDSSRNFLTLCMVMRAVELGEMMIIGFCCFFLVDLPGCKLAAAAPTPALERL